MSALLHCGPRSQAHHTFRSHEDQQWAYRTRHQDLLYPPHISSYVSTYGIRTKKKHIYIYTSYVMLCYSYVLRSTGAAKSGPGRQRPPPRRWGRTSSHGKRVSSPRPSPFESAASRRLHHRIGSGKDGHRRGDRTLRADTPAVTTSPTKGTTPRGTGLPWGPSRPASYGLKAGSRGVGS